MALRFAIGLFWLFCMDPSARAQDPLTMARSIRELKPEEARKKLPVKITGIVTHSDPRLGDFYVQDATSGIYAASISEGKKLSAGDRVEVLGVTEAGDFAPYILPTQVRKLGTGSLPEPEPFQFQSEDSRWLDAQYVQVVAVVDKITTWDGYAILHAETLYGTGRICIPGEDNAPKLQELKDAVVRVRGVAVARFNSSRRQERDVRVLVQSTEQIAVLRRPEESPLRPQITAMPLREVQSFSADPYPSARLVKIRAVVTRRIGDTILTVQDGTRGATAILQSPEKEIAIGDEVNIVGYLTSLDKIVIRNARLKKVGVAELPEPLPIDAAGLLSGDYCSRLVKVEGTIDTVRITEGSNSIWLSEGGVIFHAVLPGNTPAQLQAGARVAVVGSTPPLYVLSNRSDRRETLFLHRPEDIQILAPAPQPPWAGAEFLVYVLAALTIISLGAIFWVATLRRMVRSQTAQIQKHYAVESELEAKLQQSQKMESLGRLSGGIAHDFNNLLTVINGNGELAAEFIDPDHPAAELIDEIRKAGDKASGLASQLLTLSSKRPVRLTSVNLNEVVNDAVKLLNRVIGEDIRIETRLSVKLESIQADIGMLHQILMNLGVNSRDAMPNGGRLTLSTTRVLSSDGRPLIRLSVADTGCGMDEETQKKIFDPFFTTKPFGKGTGLGLATVYGIVQSLNGQIRVHSAPDRGAVFEIDFPPREIASPSPTTRVSAVNNTTVIPDKTILIVEDEDAVRDVAVRFLETAKYRVLTACSPLEAIRKIQASKSSIDLLLTDIIMPEMNGRVLAEQIREHRPAIRVLYMSGYTGDVLGNAQIEADGASFLPKPFSGNELLNKVSEVLTAEIVI